MTTSAPPTRWPGPGRLEVIRELPRLARDHQHLLWKLLEYAETYGDTVRLPFRFPTYLIRDPEDVRHVLVGKPLRYHKAGGVAAARELTGHGLVSSEEPLHARQRKVMQPMFHHRSIASWGEMMVRCAEREMAGWPEDGELDLHAELTRLMISITGLALFSLDLHREGRELGDAYTEALRLGIERVGGVALPLAIPSPANRRYRRVIEWIDRRHATIIADRQAMPDEERPDDLLTMLVQARFEDGEPMDPRQLSDEVKTMVIAGHDTVTNSLSWALHAISEHPEVEERLQDEWDAVLGGRAPTPQDLPKLGFTEQVLAETMRLHPPAWTIQRRVVEADELPGGLKLKPGDELMISQFVSHRNPRFFPDPSRFDPDRFASDRRGELPKFAYFPFGGGPRICIGEPLARMEQMILLPTLGQRFRFEVPGGRGAIGYEPLLTLRPKGGLRMRLRRR